MMESAQITGCFAAHAAALVLYARQWLPPGSAEDVVQDAFVRLMLQPRAPASLKAWLFRTVRNTAINQWRSAQARVGRERETARNETYFEPAGEDRLDSEAATVALQNLPPAQREVVVLRIWADMTLQEISALTGVPVSTVFHHYQKGLSAIRGQMGVPCRMNND